MPPHNPLPPNLSPLRSEGEQRQTSAGDKLPSPQAGHGDEVIYTRTTIEIWNKIKPFARQMRHESTPAEDALWQQLRRKNLMGYKFRRQHPVDRFIVDFFCKERRLVIEVDGEIHDYMPEEDALRTEFLESRGLHVIRFTNDEVLVYIDSVLQRIYEALNNSDT